MSKITSPPQDWREGRRLRARQLYEAGWKQKDIASALGVSEGAVSQWRSKPVPKAVKRCERFPILVPSPS